MDPKAVVPKWARIVLRTVGAVNAALALLGTSFLADSVHFFLTRYTVEWSYPYFRFAFIAMTLVNVAFLVILLITAVRFIQVRVSSINPYSLMVLAEFLYSVTTGILWRAERGIGRSIAAATGVGNMGVGPFEFCFLVPFLYPVVSMVLLQIIRQRYSSHQLKKRRHDVPQVLSVGAARPALPR